MAYSVYLLSLVNDPQFIHTIFTELRAGTKFSVNFDGVGVDINAALIRATTGRGTPFDLELLEIHLFIKEGGDPKQIEFFLNGEVIPSPF